MSASHCLTALSLVLAGCGFHLRGAVPSDLQLSRVYIQATGARQVAADLRRLLVINQVQVTRKRGRADAVVSLRNERFDDRVLSVDPKTGKVREYELAYRVELGIQRSDGTPLVAPDTIDLLRDLTFDETAALGKFSEQQLIRDEMTEDAAETILRRLESIKTR